jgi:hypothetical protein
MKFNATSVFILICLTSIKNAIASSINFTFRGTKAFPVSGSRILATLAVAKNKEQRGSGFFTTIQLVPRGGAIAGLSAKDVAALYEAQSAFTRMEKKLQRQINKVHKYV